MVGRREEVVGLQGTEVADEKAGEERREEKGWEDARGEGETSLQGESVEGRRGGDVGADVICAAMRNNTKQQRETSKCDVEGVWQAAELTERPQSTQCCYHHRA